MVGRTLVLPLACRCACVNGHGGELALAALAGYGVREMFTLSGGHIFPFYDAIVKGPNTDWRIVDVRHEQTATFAAEATARARFPILLCPAVPLPTRTRSVGPRR